MKREEAKQSIERIRREKLEKDSADLRALLKILAEELNSKDMHFIWELLQNAEDNEYGGVEPALSLRIETTDPTQTPLADGCLVVLNNETGFEEKHVLGICSAGNGTKQRDDDHDYIGEKGIGFKSVFRVSDRPHIFSNGYQFRFARPEQPGELGYILPHWVEDKLPAAKDGWTAILLPVQPGKRALVAAQLSRIAPECILFLRKLKRLEVGDGGSISRDDAKCPLVTLTSNGEESVYFVHSEPFDKPTGFIEERRQGITRRKLTVAFPLKTPGACKGRVYAFLPTEFDSGLPFLVNADFVLNSNRERVLEDRPWNQWLRDLVAPTFVNAFLLLVHDPERKTGAYRFLPLTSDLTPGAEFFAPIVEPIQKRLQAEKCILTESGDYGLPKQTYFAGPLSRKLLSDAPPRLANFPLVDPGLESFRERLKPLEVQILTITQVLTICGDAGWLHDRQYEWWETLFELLSQHDIKAETVSEFPLFKCRDGVCHPPTAGVFHHADGQPTTTSLPAEWPPVHLFDVELQTRLQQKPKIWAWLTRTAGLHPFSIQSYITDKLLSWMRGQTGSRLVRATLFIAANVKHFETQSEPAWRQRLRINHALQTVSEKMPWLLADGQVVLPEQRAGKQLVTPECLEGKAGWNLLFPALDRHFLVLNDAYCQGLSPEAVSEMRELFGRCNVTAFPDPVLRELEAHDAGYEKVFSRCSRHIVFGTPRLRDYAAPGWLLGLENVEQIGNGQNKIAALERWLKEKDSTIQDFLRCSTKSNYENNWQSRDSWSEFGSTLHDRAWLRTTKGYAKPTSAFLDTPEFREFFGDSVPYVTADVSPALLERLDVRVHLTAEILVGMLREMAASLNPDYTALVKIYRRLQDSNFDVEVFRREKLIFLAEPTPRWLSTDKLVWEDAGQLFDDDFGYLTLPGNYGNSELRQFFTEKLRVPLQPALKQYADAWRKLTVEPAPARAIVERKLKVILARLADSQNEVSNSDWWLELKPHLRVWTLAGEFQPPARVYMPDHSVAVELFADSGRIHVAFPLKPTRVVMSFLSWIACPSLAEAVQTRLLDTTSESQRTESSCLTPAAKELCVSLVCSHQGWQEHTSLLQVLLETAECDVSAITVEYFFQDNPDADTRQQSRDAYWDAARGCLLLRNGVDSESLRDAAAKSIAAEFFGEAASADVQAEFFRILTASVERARKLMVERSNWRLSMEQQEWLRNQHWQVLITELDEKEQPPLPRPSQATTTPAPPGKAVTSPVAPSSQEVSNQATKPPTPDAGGATQSPPASKQQLQRVTDVATATTQSRDVGVKVIRAQAKRNNRRTGGQTQIRQRQSTSSQINQGGGLDSLSRAEKNELENRAIKKAIDVLKSSKQEWGTGYDEVEDVHEKNLGYDLHAKRKSGDSLRVELKAHRGEAKKVNVTRKEWKEFMRQTPSDRWELWNIEQVEGAEIVITRHNKIPSHALEPSAYWIDLNECSWSAE